MLSSRAVACDVVLASNTPVIRVIHPDDALATALVAAREWAEWSNLDHSPPPSRTSPVSGSRPQATQMSVEYVAPWWVRSCTITHSGFCDRLGVLLRRSTSPVTIRSMVSSHVGPPSGHICLLTPHLPRPAPAPCTCPSAGRSPSASRVGLPASHPPLRHGRGDPRARSRRGL